MRSVSAVISLASLFGCFVKSLQLDVQSHDSIKQAARTIAAGMMDYYHGNETGGSPGLLDQPYYWWEAGAMFGGLIDYWQYTGDSTYNEIVSQAILWQASPTRDFMPPNQTKDEGNDDQAFWGMAAMSAAETRFPDPPTAQPQWLALAQGVFNAQAARWDNATCGGGLRWQVFSWNAGYTYKNTISQGGFFNIAARLGAYTKNDTFLQWAETTYDWCSSIGLISPSYQVFDGSESTLNCSALDHTQWSYNSAIILHGSAVMWNQTTGETQQKWQIRVDDLLNAMSVFFTGPGNNIMIEAACEKNPAKTYCNSDQLSFKAYLARWLAATAKVAPWTRERIMPLLQASALAAAGSCSGGSDGVTCGNKWWVNSYDGLYGVGQQLSALEVIQSNLLDTITGPVSNDTGGTSTGDPNAGTDGNGVGGVKASSPVTSRDKVGAWFLTVLLVLMSLGTVWWMLSD